MVKVFTYLALGAATLHDLQRLTTAIHPIRPHPPPTAVLLLGGEYQQTWPHRR